MSRLAFGPVFALPVLGLAVCAPWGSARASDGLEDEVEAALDEAGPLGRARLEAFLLKAAVRRDDERLAAARFLVANMPGKGYVEFELRDAKGAAIPFDALTFPTFPAAQEALDAIEKEKGSVDFARARLVPDGKAVTADFLARHLDRALAIWRATPPARRVDFATFCEHVLPYRGSEEPVEDWLGPLSERHGALRSNESAAAVYEQVTREAGARVRFDERYYLHPTDQGFSEMEKTGMGRCEDITNMTTYLARSAGLATAADFTPAWAHRDNNHAWNVLLDARGRGHDPVGARAAKVYRKTWSLRRDGLAAHLPKGREAPNRWLASRSIVDVTDQYGETTDVEVVLDGKASSEAVAYLAVFNGGEWVAIAWSPVRDGHARFRAMGRGILYLPAIHDGRALLPAAAPRIVHRDGRVAALAGTGAATELALLATTPEQQSVDTGAVTPVSALSVGATYVLRRWGAAGWEDVAEVAGAREPLRHAVSPDGLHWLVETGSRRLERPFTVENGRQRFW